LQAFLLPTWGILEFSPVLLELLTSIMRFVWVTKVFANLEKSVGRNTVMCEDEVSSDRHRCLDDRRLGSWNELLDAQWLRRGEFLPGYSILHRIEFVERETEGEGLLKSRHQKRDVDYRRSWSGG
jgi:hypothetical protein